MDLSPIFLFTPGLVLFAGRLTKGVTRLSSSERASVTRMRPNDVKEVLIGILFGDVTKLIDNALGIVVKRLKLFCDFFTLYVFIFF